MPPFLRPLIALDAPISHSLHTLTRPITPRSLLLMEFLDGFCFSFLVVLFLFFVIPRSSPSRPQLLSPLRLCSLLDLLFIAVVKFLVRRSRPLYANHDEYNIRPSFPSTISLFLVAIHLGLSLLLPFFSRLPILDFVANLKSHAHLVVTSLICRWICQ